MFTSRILSPVKDWNERYGSKKSPCPSAMLKQGELAFNILVDREEEQLRGAMQ
jgi:hypothetical protein